MVNPETIAIGVSFVRESSRIAFFNIFFIYEFRGFFKARFIEIYSFMESCFIEVYLRIEN